MGWLVVVLGVVLVTVLILGPLLLSVINRLDRLHVRTDAAWACLDAMLARRSVVSRTIAAAGHVDDASALRTAADQAESANKDEREGAENELSRLLAELDRNALPRELVEELSDAEHRVVIARRVHNDVVRDTKALRRRRLVRWLRLAGTAPQPHYFEIAEPDLDTIFTH